MNINYTSLTDGPKDDAAITGQTSSAANGVDNHGLHPDLVRPQISVLRPNTMVVTATTPFTLAKRSVFLRHFAKELENANGLSTINTMVQLCSRTMSLHHDKDSRKQAPTTYDVLRQPLILPRSLAYDKKRVQDSKQSGKHHY